MASAWTLNSRAVKLANALAADAEVLRISESRIGGARVLDCGIAATGGLHAGVGLARVCLADLANVGLVPGGEDALHCPLVCVSTDHPVLACMASQYAGWQVSAGK